MSIKLDDAQSHVGIGLSDMKIQRPSKEARGHNKEETVAERRREKKGRKNEKKKKKRLKVY